MSDFQSAFLYPIGVAIVNFISVKVYNRLNSSPKNYFWKDKFDDLKDYKPNLSFDELKRRTRIVVIDDENSFPISLFRGEGYAIDKWSKVTDYNKLQSGVYDIIILDIKGVALHISEEDGLGVLQSIKNYNPAQIIIAYSQHSFDLSKAKFWELADETIAKPSDFLKMKATIDNIILNQFQPERYINIMHDILLKNHYSNKDIRKIDIHLIRNIKDKTTPNWNSVFESAITTPELFIKLQAVASTILKLY
jgi:DNA-binding response OmpR family regulator